MKSPGMSTWLAALSGNPAAQFSIAIHCWHRGWNDQSIYWARRAGRKIQQANVFLANQLTTYRPDDPMALAEAVAVVKKAAEDGCAEAQQTLAAYYFNGEGVPRDIEESNRWCLKAAQNGRVECWERLIKHHLDGEQGPVDVDRARYYCRLAAESGHPEFLSALEIDLQNERVLGPARTGV
jgi:TPR repeat protein